MSVLTLFFYLGILVVSGVVITKSIRLFISSSTKLAHILGISTFTISFLIISIATSLPELVVAITSGLAGNSILSYGDAIGSNLALLTLIVALPVLFGKSLSTKEIVRSKNVYFSAFFLVLALALAVDGRLTRLDGGILLIAYVYYFLAVLKKEALLQSLIEKFEHTNAWKEGVLFAFSLLLLILASEGIVHSALSISALLDLNLGYVGLTITALGTSLPEIAFVLGIVKAREHEEEILGDIVGSVVANSTLVLGTAALLSPIILNGSTLGFPTIVVLISTLLLFLAFSKSGETIDKREALILLGVYVLFISLEFILVI